MLIGVYFYHIGILFLVTTDFLLLAKNPFGRDQTIVAGEIKLQHYGIFQGIRGNETKIPSINPLSTKEG